MSFVQLTGGKFTKVPLFIHFLEQSSGSNCAEKDLGSTEMA